MSKFLVVEEVGGGSFHRNMGKTIFVTIITVVLIFFDSASFAELVLKDPCDISLLPKPVQEVLRHKFPTWQLLTLSDLTDEEKNYWLKSKGGEKCPGIAAGHIETWTYLSYAMVLLSREPTKPVSKFLIISERRKERFEIVVTYPYFGFVSTVPPGKYEGAKGADYQQPNFIQLRLDGIVFEGFQKGKILYYWKNGRYHSLIISE
jgi:hypothetical protein